VVDDDPTVCLVLKKLLSAAGHTVHLARDGHEGLALALQYQPNLVITDLMMAGHDGLQLIRNLRQTEFAARSTSWSSPSSTMRTNWPRLSTSAPTTT
jgi:CheY-like chemotaxis protein